MIRTRFIALVLGTLVLVASALLAKDFVPVFPKQAAEAKIGELAPKAVAGGIQFSYRTRMDAKRITLAGTFNGWSKEADALAKGADGVWRIVKRIPPGAHQYKFVIDGSMWNADPHNPARTPDGNANSMVSVTGAGDVKISSRPVSKEAPGFWYTDTKAVDSAAWIRDAVIYEVYPRVYTPTGFRGLADKLGHLKELGVDTLWLMPIFPVGQKNKKGSLGCAYAVRDYYDVAPEHGSKADFKALVDKAHGLGMRVVLDWVPNHSAWDNKLLEKHPEWYERDKAGKITHPHDTDWTDTAGFDWRVPALRDYMVDALKYWIREFGVDGYRMDVAGRIPTDFWDRLRRELKSVKPDVLLLAESEDPELNSRGFDLTYAGGLRSATRDLALGAGTQYDFAKVYHAGKYGYPKGALRMHWFENHDQEHALKVFGPKAVYPAAAVLLTLDGVPLLLMGQEFGDSKWLDWHSLFDALQLGWDRFDKKLFAHYKALVALRKGSPALSRGEMTIVQNDNPKVVSYVRRHGAETVLVVVNLGTRDAEILLAPDELAALGLSGKAKLTRLFGDWKKTIETKDLARLEFEVDGYKALVYRIEK